MRYIITESKLNQTIVEYINKLFPVDEINHINPYTYDDETGEEGDDENRVEFYIGDYDAVSYTHLTLPTKRIV